MENLNNEVTSVELSDEERVELAKIKVARVKALGLFLKYNESGQIDFPETYASFEQLVSEAQETVLERGEHIRAHLEALLVDPAIPKGMRIGVPYTITTVAAKLGAGPLDAVQVQQEVKEYIEQHSAKTRESATANKPYTVTRGRGGGFSRWDMVPVAKK